MAEIKTKLTGESVEEFLNKIEDIQRREDCFKVVKMMNEVTDAEGKMWGTAIIGFGDTKYKNSTGKENDWFIMGFSPRKQNISFYFMYGYKKNEALMEKLGKYKIEGSCLHIKYLKDINIEVFRELLTDAFKNLKLKSN